MQCLWGAGQVLGEEKDRIETEEIPQHQERRGALKKSGVLALLLDRAKGDGKSWKQTGCISLFQRLNHMSIAFRCHRDPSVQV